MSTVNILIIAGTSLAIVMMVIGTIVDPKGTWKILKWVLLGVGAVLLGWLALKFKVNIGKHVNNMLGRRKKMPTSVLNETGDRIGEVVEIVTSKNPVRDQGVVGFSDGTQIELPQGVRDVDVERVTVINGTTYHVEVKHSKLTDVFARGDDD